MSFIKGVKDIGIANGWRYVLHQGYEGHWDCELMAICPSSEV
ncbi:hypothetical protein [Peribacillus kribbensis]|nr:hypothetical protein [Peribacillus kribbensis]